jgi:glutathione-regulated potassium-efflux system ancillary protein KefF
LNSSTSSARVLVVYAHPEPHRSRVNRRLADAARAMPGVLVHDLYALYPDFYIDVAREQALIAEADLIVLLHPIRWYAMPSLLKEWVDVVFEAGWAYGAGATGLAGKGYLLAATTGGAASAYTPDGMHNHPFAAFLPPYEQTARLCGMAWHAPLVLYGAHHASEAEVAAHVAAFTARLAAFSVDHTLKVT